MMRWLALDQGTTSTRLLAVEGGTCRLIGQLRHKVLYPSQGRVEQDAAEILENCRRLLAEAGPATAMGLANQGESCLAWDSATGEPLSPILVWQDRRTLGELARLDEARLAPLIADRAGLPLDPYFSAAKLGWLLKNLPAVAEARRKGRLHLGTTDAFLLERLSGHFATDRATASRTSLMNLTSGEWDADLCDVFGVPIDCLPEIRGNIQGFGAIAGLPVTAAIVDQQAALYGHGCRQPGAGKITFGTGAFALAIAGATRPMHVGGLLPTVAWDLGKGMVYALDGGVQDAGSAVEWALRAGLASSVAEFDNFPDAPAIDRGLVFLPSFSGLGAPHWDRSAAPVIIGLTQDMTRRDLCQALVEGIAFQTALLTDAMSILLPLASPLKVDGGLVASRYFVDFLAQMTRHEILLPDMSERTAFGTAALAGLAMGETVTLDETSHLVPRGAAKPERLLRFNDALQRSRGWVG